MKVGHEAWEKTFVTALRIVFLRVIKSYCQGVRINAINILLRKRALHSLDWTEMRNEYSKKDKHSQQYYYLL